MSTCLPQLNPDDPQELNSYSYANNSPVTFSDPDGKAWAIFNVVAKAVRYVVTSKPVVNFVRTVKTNVIAVVDWVKKGITQLFNMIKAWIVQIIEIVKKVITWIKQVFKHVVDFVKKVVKWVADNVRKIVDVVKKVVAKVKQIFQKIRDKLSPPQTTPEDLTAFGNATKPRDPRPGKDKDIEVDKDGNVHPTNPPRGASTFKDPYHPEVTLTGGMWTLPKGTQLPSGLRVIADGKDVGGSQPPGHHTIYPSRSMSYDEFVGLYNSLPWQYAGKKK